MAIKVASRRVLEKIASTWRSPCPSAEPGNRMRPNVGPALGVLILSSRQLARFALRQYQVARSDKRSHNRLLMRLPGSAGFLPQEIRVFLE